MLSRQSVVRGLALIQFENRGEDPHDLRLRRIPRAGGAAASRSPETPPGARASSSAPPPGRYRLWCSLPGHEQLGMRAELRVRRR